jgi:hypothetical protein
MLMENANLTWAQDLGADTELLSGDFFVPFGRSTSHQLWSSAMVVTPALRGMFGIDVDALAGTVHLDPHLPADWDNAEVQRLHVGQSVCSLDYQRQGQNLVVKVVTISGPAIRLATALKDARIAADGSSITFALPPVEVAVPHALPLPGARTSQMKVLGETTTPRSLKLELEADAGSVVELKLRRNGAKLNVHAEGAELLPAEHSPDGSNLDSLTVKFPAGIGYQQQTVTLHW